MMSLITCVILAVKYFFLHKILFSKFTLLEMTFITVLYSNSYYCLHNILLLKFTLLGITLIIVLAHQSYMGARGSCHYLQVFVSFYIGRSLSFKMRGSASQILQVRIVLVQV
jgi:hypothetical protein